MKAKIFSVLFDTSVCSTSYSMNHSIESLEKEVNFFLKSHPEADVKWLQSSSQASTRLTAIVTLRHCLD